MCAVNTYTHLYANLFAVIYCSGVPLDIELFRGTIQAEIQQRQFSDIADPQTSFQLLQKYI